MRGYVRRMAASPDDVDDFVSEALLRAYATENWPRITAGRAFLFTIARNLVIDAARRNKVVSIDVAADLDALQSAVDTERQLQARDELRRLEEIVESFPAQCRRAFILRRVQERSYVEIAEEMGLSVSTVEKHVAKALTLLMQSELLRGESDDVVPARTGEEIS